MHQPPYGRISPQEPDCQIESTQHCRFGEVCGGKWGFGMRRTGYEKSLRRIANPAKRFSSLNLSISYFLPSDILYTYKQEHS